MLDCSIIHYVDQGESLEKYHANYIDQEVMIRIFDDDYYTGRFLREGIALRYIADQEKSFVTPKIVDEWPDLLIRMTEWIELDPSSPNPQKSQYEELWEDLSSLDKFNSPYELKSSLIQHLRNTSTMHQSYQDFFENKIEIILDSVPWDSVSTNIVHGDLNPANIGSTGDQLVVFDWEYAATGSTIYDLAYLQVTSEHDFGVPTIWKALVTGVITHWYLQEEQFSPKLAVEWVEELERIVKEINN